MDPAELIEALKSTPAALRASVRSLKGAEIGASNTDGGWSALEVVRHVRAADAIISQRVWQVLVRDAAPLTAFDERGWGTYIAAADVPIDAQLAAFAIHRAELTALLRTLTPEQWQRAGVHEERGHQTVAAICEQLVVHEAEHVAQMQAIVRSFGREPGVTGR